MPRKPKTLRVVVNPFAKPLDHDGRPAAAVATDPAYHNPDNHLVGATRAHEMLEARAPVDLRTLTGDDRLSLQDSWREFSPEPLTIPDTPYYRECCRPSVDGGPSLLPANEATARALGVAFRDPSAVILADAKFRAEQWAKDHDGELPEWASEAPEHPSHTCHAQFLAAHAAKATPSAAPADTHGGE